MPAIPDRSPTPDEVRTRVLGMLATILERDPTFASAPTAAARA